MAKIISNCWTRLKAIYHSLLDSQAATGDTNTLILKDSLENQSDSIPPSQMRSGSGKPVHELAAAANEARINSLLSRANASGLCVACSNINLQSRYPQTHHRYPELTLSASRGCPICRFISGNVSAEISTRTAEITVNLAKCSLEYKVPTDGGGYRAFFELFAKRETPSGLLETTVFREVSPDPTSSTNIQLIRSWINNCHEKHSQCKRALDYTLPTRVIDVSGHDLRLRELKSKNVPYITLSHCWGTKSIMTTLKSNLSSHMRCINPSTLPQAFLDAIIITKELGISYLWVDSLCILQDSEEDWLEECPKMGTYYRNSYINISALESPDSHHGFLNPRSSIGAVEIANTGVWMRRKFPHCREIFRDAALNHRGWFLQERLLSTCVLHFTKQEMLWECQSSTTRESSFIEDCQPTDFRSLVSSEGGDFKRCLFSENSDKFGRDEAYDVWMRLVRQYSQRSLTYSSDRLPAISSLAALMATKTESPYIAGIWSNDLHGLAWFSDGPDERICHQFMDLNRSSAVAPSWSWANMKSSITYRFNDEERVKSSKDPILIDAHASLLGVDPFGSVSGGFITIQALTKPVQCMDFEMFSDLSKSIFGYVGPVDSRSSRRTRFNALGLYICGEDGKIVGTGSFDDPMAATLHQCKAVRIAERVYERRLSRADSKVGLRKEQSIIYFLLVKPVPQCSGSWRRVGMGLTRNFEFQEFYDNFFDSWDWEQLRLI